MYTAKVTMGKIVRNSKKMTDRFISLLSCYCKNGQICGDEWPIYMNDSSLNAFVSIPDHNSLRKQYMNTYVRNSLQELNEQKLFVNCEVLGFDPGSLKACKCKNRSFLILYTTFLSQESCLRCGDCFKPIPLYLIPHLYDHEYCDILSWESDYKACDSLQMNCTTGERFGERQLFDSSSSLSRNGISICKDIEKLTKQNTFYYLMKSRGKSIETEKGRLCPICNGKWYLEEKLHNIFEFQCKKCHLLSNIAWST